MPVNVDYIDMYDLLCEEDSRYLFEELDEIVEELTKKSILGSISLGYGSTHLTLWGKKSYLDEIRCIIYPVHAKKRSAYSTDYVVVISHLVCQLVTGSGGKEIWVEITDSTRPIARNKWNSEMRFDTLGDARDYIREKDMKHDIEGNRMIKKFWKLMKEYAEIRSTPISLTCDGGNAEDAAIILGDECPWNMQTEEEILHRLKL